MNTVFSSTDRAKAGAGQPRSGGPSLLYLSCHNSTGLIEKINQLKGSHKKTAHALVGEIKALAAEFGVERLGFLTPTFAANVTDRKEAQRHFNSLNTHVLKLRYERAICVMERQRRGAVHFHLVVVMAEDIRTGVDFAAFEKHDYRSACPYLRAEWRFWRKTAVRYGFGRTELLPVKSTADGIAYYVGKYISKHVGQRSSEDSGAKLVRYIGFAPGQRKFNSHFSWSQTIWRAKLIAFAKIHGFKNSFELKVQFGPRWAFLLSEVINATEPSSDVALSQSQHDQEFVNRIRPELLAAQRLMLHRSNSEISTPTGREYILSPPRHFLFPNSLGFARERFTGEAERHIPSSDGVATVPVRCGSGLKEVPLTTRNQLSNLCHDV